MIALLKMPKGNVHRDTGSAGMVDINEYAYGVGNPVVSGAVSGAADENADPAYRMSVTHRFEDMAAIWRDFEKDALCTPFQRYDWLESWQREIGAPGRITPCLFHAISNDGRTLFILPLAYWRYAGVRILGWLGDEHSNYKMGLFDREWFKTLTPGEARQILKRVLEFLPPIDVIQLIAGPGEWEGCANPFTRISALPSASYSHAISLQPDFEALYTSRRSAATIKKARKRERSFNRRHKLEFALATDRDEILRVLREVYRQKAFRLAEMGVHDFFTDRGVKAFFEHNAIRGANDGAEDGENPFHLFYLKAGGEIAATWMGIAHRGRMCGMMNTMSSKPELRKHSPGEVLLRFAIKYCCEHGFDTFDLAVGESRYKNEWCDQTLTLFLTIVPVTFPGLIHVQGTKLRLKVKRVIKQSDRLWPLSQKLRAWTACWVRLLFGAGVDPCRKEGRKS